MNSIQRSHLASSFEGCVLLKIYLKNNLPKEQGLIELM